MNPLQKLICLQSQQDTNEHDEPEDEHDKPDKTNPKQGLEKADKDDEEEWGRIPIPQSDDSDEYTWLDELSDSSESEQEKGIITSAESTAPTNEKGEMNKIFSDDFAFRHGPRRDGNIRNKDGSLLTLNELLPLTKTNSSTSLKTTRDLNKEKRFKSKTKVRAKMMREIRKKVKRIEKMSHDQKRTRSKQINLRLSSLEPSNKPIYRTEQNLSEEAEETQQDNKECHQ
jgi:hypothetical protein